MFIFLHIFFTTVLGNIFYQTAIGHLFTSSLMGASFSRSIFGFEFNLFFTFHSNSRSIMLSSRSMLLKLAKSTVPYIPEFTKSFYLIINVTLYAYIIYELIHTDSYLLLFFGNDPIISVKARFLLLERLGLPPQIVLMFLLQFLGVYALISALRNGNEFWYLFVTWHSIILTMCLVMLNMKWPVVVWVFTLGLTVIVTSRTLKQLFVTVGLILFLFRGIHYNIICSSPAICQV